MTRISKGPIYIVECLKKNGIDIPESGDIACPFNELDICPFAERHADCALVTYDTGASFRLTRCGVECESEMLGELIEDPIKLEDERAEKDDEYHDWLKDAKRLRKLEEERPWNG